MRFCLTPQNLNWNKIHPYVAILSATCGNNICHSGFPCATTQHQNKVVITSATNLRHNIYQYNVMATTDAITMWLPFTTVSIKSTEHSNTHTPKVLTFIKVNIFLRPEKAMLWLGKSLPSTGKLFCHREKNLTFVMFIHWNNFVGSFCNNLVPFW